jgi:hypothetical protein
MSAEGYEQEYIQEAFATNWIAPLGANVNGFEEAHRDFVWVRQFFLGGYRVQICACIVARCYPFFMRAVKAAALYMGAPGTMFSKDGLDKANMDPNPT